eukprot:SAG31_NODE_7412_length_1696_cov_1.253601_2_plen_265_part_01
MKIADLGVAKVLTTHLRAAHTGVGTPYYLSPEVAQRRPYNAKSDVWALGCILYECCTGRHPFTGNNQQQLFQQIIKGSYRPIGSSFSAEMSAMIKSCLTRNVDSRPAPHDLVRMPVFVAKCGELSILLPPEALVNRPTKAVSDTAAAHPAVVRSSAQVARPLAAAASKSSNVSADGKQPDSSRFRTLLNSGASAAGQPANDGVGNAGSEVLAGPPATRGASRQAVRLKRPASASLAGRARSAGVAGAVGSTRNRPSSARPSSSAR